MTGPIIQTERMNLVLPCTDHLPAYVAYCGGLRSQFVGGPFDSAKAFEKLCAMVGHWRLRGFGRYVMTLKSTGQPIGHVGALQIDTAEPPEMKWTIWEDAYEGKGYAIEAVTAYLAHVPKVDSFAEMLIRIENKNQRSLRLADRIGATRDEIAVAPHWMPTAVTLRLRVTNNG